MSLPTFVRVSLALATLLPATASLVAATLNVRDFGATGNGVTKDTAAFQQALDACAAAGGGEVLVPDGEYLSGSLELKSYTTLRLERHAVILGSPDLEDYPVTKIRWECRWIDAHRALLSAHFAGNIAIIGYGRISGHPSFGARRQPRPPCVIEPVECTNVRLEDVTVTQNQMWAVHLAHSDEIFLKNVIVRGGGAHGAGVVVDSSQHVRLDGCDLEGGDDCVVIQAGRDPGDPRDNRPAADILIRDCSLAGSVFAGIGIGGEVAGGVRGVHIEDCRFRLAQASAIAIRSRPGRQGFIEDVSAQNLDVQAPKGTFLQVDLLNGGAPGPGAESDGLTAVRNLRFANARVTVGTLVEAASTSPGKPVDGFVLENLTGTAAKGISLANMVNVTLADIRITGAEGGLISTTNVTGTGFDGAGAARERTVLWNGRDLAGWTVYLNDASVAPATAWSTTDGVLRLDSKASGYIKTEREYSNYRLHVEWRWPAVSKVDGTDPAVPANSNSSVMVHVHGPDAIWPLCFECQLKHGNAGQVVGMGLDIPDAPLLNNRKRSPRLAEPSEKPPGEWNAYEIICRGDTLECSVNGVRQNRVEKLPVSAGAIALQLEGFPIEFRNVWLEPL